MLLLLLSHFSRIWLCVTPSLGFSRKEHWSGLPFPSPMHKSEKWKWSRSVMSNSLRPHGLQPTRLLRPWNFPSKSTGVGCHCLNINKYYINGRWWQWQLHCNAATVRRYPSSKGKGETQQDGRMGKIAFRIKHNTRQRHSGGSNIPCVPGPRDPTETETELYLSVSWGGTGQQWTAVGAGTLDAVDLGMA